MNKFQNKSQEELSPLAVGYMWSVRITSISIEAALIILFGFWLDRRLGTIPLFIFVGTILAMIVSLSRLVSLIANQNRRDEPSPEQDAESSSEQDAKTDFKDE